MIAQIKKTFNFYNCFFGFFRVHLPSESNVRYRGCNGTFNYPYLEFLVEGQKNLNSWSNKPNHKDEEFTNFEISKESHI